MPTLDKKEVEEIALLARVHLDATEIASMQQELGSILEHFSTLASLDTTDIAPMTHAVPIELRLRFDEPMPSLPVDEALRAAPAKEGDVFVVPAIITGSGE